MSRAWVGDLDDGGQLFSAHVEYDEAGPFAFTNGPDFVAAGEAIAWARRHAEKVRVRVGSSMYTAGVVPIASLPPWPEPVPDVVPREGQSSAWQVEARTAWFRPDRREVAARLVQQVFADPTAREVRHGLTETGFRVTFRLDATSIVAARERASAVVRSAWRRSGTRATPGDDFDVPSIRVSAR